MAPRRKLRVSPEERAKRAIERMSAGTISGRIESASPARRLPNLKATQTASGCPCPINIRTCTPSGGASYDAEILADSPVLYLPMNELSGTTAYDLTGNGHDGTYNDNGTGLPTLGEDGPITSDPANNYAPGFGGNDVSVPDHSALDITGDISLGIWCYPTLGFPGENDMIFKNNAFGTSNYDWFLNAAVGNAKFGQDTGSGRQTVAASAGVANVTWTFLFLVKSGTTVTHYLNAATNGSGTISNIGVTTNASHLRIARNEENTHTFYGRLARAVVYNTAISGARISAYYAAATAPPVTQCALAVDDDVLLIDAAGTIALPPTATAQQHIYYVKNIAATGDVILDPAGGERIDDAGSLTLGPLDSAAIVSDGTEWWVL